MTEETLRAILGEELRTIIREELCTVFKKEFKPVNERLDKMDERLTKVEVTLQNTAERLTKVEGTLTGVVEKLDYVDERVPKIDVNMENIITPKIRLALENSIKNNYMLKKAEDVPEIVSMLKDMYPAQVCARQEVTIIQDNVAELFQRVEALEKAL